MSTAAARFLEAAEARLAALDAELARAKSVEDVAWTLCEFAGRELELADCVIYLLEADHHTLGQHAAWGPKRVAQRIFEPRFRLDIGDGVVGHCAQFQVPQLIADTRLDRRYLVDDDRRLSELAVPICRGGVLLGVLDTEHPQADAYDSRHVRALVAIADRGSARLVQLPA